MLFSKKWKKKGLWRELALPDCSAALWWDETGALDWSARAAAKGLPREKDWKWNKRGFLLNAAVSKCWVLAKLSPAVHKDCCHIHTTWTLYLNKKRGKKTYSILNKVSIIAFLSCSCQCCFQHISTSCLTYSPKPFFYVSYLCVMLKLYILAY